jgi:hypothetical protein
LRFGLVLINLVAGVIFAVGCGLDGPSPSESKHDAPAAGRPAERNVAAKKTPGTAEKKPDVAGGERSAAPQPDVLREKAAVGMGEKGRGYGGDMITEPVKVLWNVKERLALMQIQQALDLYKAGEGHAPKSHQEFMDRIIKANDIKLPTLPPGQRYVYDPSKEELMVERPKDL